MESTDLESVEFDETWYLSQNQDVALSVKSGGWETGLEHYLAHGRAEGRLPRCPAPNGKSNGEAPAVQPAADAPALGNQNEPSLRELYPKHNGKCFLNPCDLSVTTAPIRRIALIGSCFLQSWGFHENNPSNCVADVIVANNAGEMPEPPGGDGEQPYDFQVIQVPLRSVLKDAALWHIPNGSRELHQQAFDQACEYLAFQLKTRMQWNLKNGMLTFVANFLVPQRNLLGCLLPRFNLSNPEFFIHKLNEHLERLVGSYRNAYILDADRIAASIGRRFLQDDIVGAVCHNSLLGLPDVDTTRIERMEGMAAYFDVTSRESFRYALWSEINAMFRTVRQVDSVKLVVVDLDDTLWNGVSGDVAEVDPHMVEGWPLGFVEALCYLKKRGILLAIASKNDEQRIRHIWPKIFGTRLSLADFAATRINWKSKAENLADMMSTMNLLPRSVIFIDDNPVERASIRHAFPEIRVLGRHPYYLRQTLLWSSETQVVSITDESSQRTEMMKAQFEREDKRTELSREEFLNAAAPTFQMMVIGSTSHPRFARALELINKTNQFNTTGRRWTLEECDGFLRAGGVFHAFSVADSYTAYGLAGVVLLKDATIVQWVMSCRVLGYEIEQAVMAAIVESVRAGFRTEIHGHEIHGHLVETEVNFPCRDLFAKCGFARTDGQWVLAGETTLRAPAHIKGEMPQS
jgi:FkbH-like protein